MTHASMSPAAERRLWSLPLRSHLTPAEVAFFLQNGFLHVPGYLDVLQHAMRRWVRDMQTWPETPGRWMMYFETPACGPQQGQRALCRMERFLEDHEDFAQLLSHPSLMAVISQVLGEPALLFKEKINFKLPGGQGFSPHQDAPAFAAFGQSYHITAMISVDPSTAENGCLELAPQPGLDAILPQAADGTLAPALVAQLRWQALPTAPGDLVLFDSFVPHRSAANRTGEPRRALYVTYNRASEGERRADYYREKRACFPPECERVAGRDYGAGAAVYNLGNPIRG